MSKKVTYKIAMPSPTCRGIVDSWLENDISCDMAVRRVGAGVVFLKVKLPVKFADDMTREWIAGILRMPGCSSREIE